MKLPAMARRTGTASPLAAVVAVVAMVAVVGIAAGGGGRQPDRRTMTVRLTAHYSRFSPATVDVRPGTTVTFVIRNLDPIDHEFIIGGPEVHERHEVGRDAHHHGDVPGEISVPAGTTASTTWTAEMGRVVFACHLPGHFAYGMAGVVRVSA